MKASKSMKSYAEKTGLVCALFLIGLAGACSAGTDLPFDMPAVTEPRIPNRTFTITDYGAVGDGQTMNTGAFAKAIADCREAGGGRVIVPAGLWLTGPIRLESRLDLHLEEGAVILFSPRFEDYPLVRQTFEGRESVRCMSPLSGQDLEHVSITGSGIIDGSGQAWRPVKKEKMTEKQWKGLVKSGGVVEASGRIWWPSREAMEGDKTVAELDKQNAPVEAYARAREFIRPVMVSLVNCRYVLLDGPTFQNSPGWNIHPLLCENMIIRNITVRNPWFSQNGDGLDLESCRNVLMHNCRFDVGDDAMCMKSGRDEYGRKRGRPTENVVIRDCTVYHGHGGFVVGSEMSGGVRNITVSNCSFLGTDVGIRFKSTRGRGGVVENIFIEDIRMIDIPTDAILFDLFYATKSPGPEASLEVPADPVTEETPQFRNIHMRNIFCQGAKNAIYMQGLPEMPVKQISFENIVISADAGATCIEAEEITFKNVKIKAKEGPVFGFYNGRQISIEDAAVPEGEGKFIKLAGGKTGDIRLKGSDLSRLKDKIEYGKGAGPEAIASK